MSYIEHFGVKVFKKPSGLKLNRKNYLDRIIFSDKSFEKAMLNNPSKIADMKKRILYNYDVNIEYFHSLSKSKFNSELESFLSKNPNFKEITDLNSVDRKSGYYIMVLDEYAQIYIGTTAVDIKKRFQNHWAIQMHIDRMIFGDKEDSILSIKSFRALDTTRIFVDVTSVSFEHENKFIKEFDDKYILNRTVGGKLDGLGEAIINRKTREF